MSPCPDCISALKIIVETSVFGIDNPESGIIMNGEGVLTAANGRAMQVRTRLREIIDERPDMSLRRLRELTGINIADLSRIQQGKLLASGDQLRKITEALGVEVEDIYPD
jgi:DNA-binding Xre family transcriptional regulator